MGPFGIGLLALAIWQWPFGNAAIWHCPYGIGQWALVNGHWPIGMGHLACGIWHVVFGIGHLALAICQMVFLGLALGIDLLALTYSH